MKAIVLERYGPPDGLQLRELARPEPAEDQVLVRVHNAAVNDWDWCFVRGRPYVYRLMFGLRRPSVAVLGAEVAGAVEATGESARRFQPGDRVYGDLSEAGFGAFAEYVCVREDALAPMPAGMSFEQAAAIPHAAMLAYHHARTDGDFSALLYSDERSYYLAGAQGIQDQGLGWYLTPRSLWSGPLNPLWIAALGVVSAYS